jgi:hypothetical protein
VIECVGGPRDGQSYRDCGPALVIPIPELTRATLSADTLPDSTILRLGRYRKAQMLTVTRRRAGIAPCGLPAVVIVERWEWVYRWEGEP